MMEKWSQRAVWAAGIFFTGCLCYTVYQTVNVALSTNKKGKGELVHDLGEVFWGEIKDYRFKIHNKGSSPLVIERVVAECGCTTTPKELIGKIIEPNESSDVPVRLDVGQMEGKFAKGIILHFGGEPKRRFRLTMKGNAKKPFSLSPEQITLEGIATSEKVAKSVTVAQISGAPPFTITDVHINTLFLSTELREVQNHQQGNGSIWTITVATIPPMSPGRLNAMLFVHTTATGLYTITVPVVLIVRE